MYLKNLGVILKLTFRDGKFSLSREKKLATLLTLSNGRFAVRGAFELYPLSLGTLVSHVYDYVPVFYRELAVLPEVSKLKVIVDGKPLNFDSSKFRLRRTLNLNNGVVEAALKWKGYGGELEYLSYRLVHRKHKGLFLINATLKFRGYDKASLISYIDTSVGNYFINDQVMIKHYVVEQARYTNNTLLLTLRTLDGKYKVTIAMKNRVSKFHERSFFNEHNALGEVFTVRGNSTIEITKYVYITRNIDSKNYVQDALKNIQKLYETDLNRLFREHVRSWRRVWRRIGLSIRGDKHIEKALKFNAFHLLQVIDDDSEYTILPARGLHGLGYRGHVFWDTEIYALPFYTLFYPEYARKILMFRCKLLEQAKENARRNGYKGAQYPWESADDGFEATPKEIPLDFSGRKIIRIWTGEEEQHITADIAYAVDKYYEITGDKSFMSKCGLKIIFETARFWASRVKYDETKGLYVIENVMGPDEYHPHVNNDYYTNLMAKYNLELAVKYFEKALKDDEWFSVVRELNISEDEVRLWDRISKNMFLPCFKNNLCEEFEGYFNLEDHVIQSSNNVNIGEKHIPESILERIDRTQIIKQASVIMAHYLLSDKYGFSRDFIKKNFDYYFKRTTHASSLSLPVYAAVAAKLGLKELAYTMFKYAAYADLGDIYGNVEDGFHVGSAGGSWQAFLYGFLGLKISDYGVNALPNIPNHWRYVKVKIKVHGKNYLVEIGDGVLKLREI